MERIKGLDQKAQQHINAQAFFISRIMETSPDAVHIVNIRTGTVVYVNKMLLTELGYSAEDIRVGQLDKNFETLYHPEDLLRIQEFKTEISQANDDDIVELEARLKARNGSWQWIKTRAKVFERDESGRPQKYIGFSQNVSDRKLIEEEKKQNSVLVALNEAKNEFFNNVSHEFRTPLSLILSPLEELITSAKLDPVQVSKLQMIQRNALRLQRLVNTQLDFARIEAGRMDAIFQPTDLKLLTEQIASSFRSLIEGGGLRFVIRCDDIKEPVYVSREMWENIVSNLLSNAFKYTLNGKIEVRLRSNKRQVQLHVRDTGVGIAKDNLSKIFERFARIETHNARTFEGSGIGLALVKELVAIHGGAIKVKSLPGMGSSFMVSIPKGKAHLPAKKIFEYNNSNSDSQALSFVMQATGWLAELPSTKKRRSPSAKPNGQKDSDVQHTVLVVEDNLDMRLFMKDLLSMDCNIATVQNSDEALAYLAGGHKVDLIVTDIMLPGSDGIELLKSIKDNESLSEIPVVMLSARADEKIKQEALKYGAVDYITKPFRSAALKSRLLLHLERTNKAKSQTVEE